MDAVRARLGHEGILLMSLIITGVVDGPLPGGLPKVVELYATAEVADLSVYGLGSANNGGGTDGQELTLSGSAAAGQFLYVASQDGDNGMAAFFGIEADFTGAAASINGDDAIELFENGVVIDTFGEPDVDGTGRPWEYLDGWAARLPGSAPSPMFDVSQWTFSGPDALDGATTNAAAGVPFPLGAYAAGAPPAPALVINEVDSDTPGTDAAEFVELYDGGAGGTSLDGLSLVLFNGNGDAAYRTISLDGLATDADGYFVIGSADVPNVDLAAFTTNGLQNGADAVALYEGAAPNAPTTTGLIDAVVYGTADPDDAELLAAFGQAMQFDEAGGADKDTDSLQRLPDGTGAFEAFLATPGAANAPPPPPAEITLVSAIQGTAGTAPGSVVGTDDLSPLLGQTVTVRAVVTADFQRSDDPDLIGGFFVQEEDADADGDALTSEGIYVFDGSSPDVDVAVGDLVEVTGTVGEFFGQTQISPTMVAILSSGEPLPLPATVDFPTASVQLTDDGEYVANLEAYEGMRIAVPEEMTVSELFNLDRFGQYTVAEGGQPVQFTQDNAPSVAGYDAHLRDVASRELVLDDGLRVQNPGRLQVIDGNDGALSTADAFRMGDGIEGITGVLGYAFDAYRINDPDGTYVGGNPREGAPTDLGGNFTVASLNVLNYFTTIDAGGAVTDNGSDPRGADSALELERQAAKLVEAIVAMDADVVGLVEIENDFAGEDFALQDLVSRVNAALGAEVYGFVDPGTAFVGTDAISNALIYKTGEVNLVGDAAILTEFEGRDFVDPLGSPREGLNRPAVAQTFEDAGTGETITVAVNHLKSKGSLSGLDVDEGQGDGQGNNNATRTAAADILADWLASDPTGQGAENVLIVGDLNAYAREDPITLLEAEGYTDLAQRFIGEEAYSYVFDGQRGTLDYALANAAALEDVVGVAEWNINSPEADALDYNLDFDRDPDLFDGGSPARNSDHDPILVAFAFDPAFNEVAGTDRRDVLVGTEGRDRIDALGGNDVVIARGGDDVVNAGAGRNVVFAGAGDDRVAIGEGRDAVFGGAGADTFVMVAPEASGGGRDRTVIWDFDTGADALDLGGAGIEEVRERPGSVTIDLADGGDRIVLVGVREFDDVLILNEGGDALLV